MVNQREVAHRLFASEFNASRVEIKGSQDERAPGYVVSPLGAKVNRLFLVGVLTEIENMAQDGGELWRARISDPTGVFTVYAGQYQPEAAAALGSLSPPQYVAVVGKSRTYEPEPGNIFVSVRPETIVVVDEEIRNQWVLDTARQTLSRVQAYRKAQASPAKGEAALVQAGVPAHLASGLSIALERYEGDVDLSYFERAIRDSLTFLLEGGALPTPAAPAQPMVSAKPVVAVKQRKGPGEEVEKKVLTFIESMASQDDKGAQWDQIVARGEAESITEDQIEEALNALMDKGVIYEPILGRLKLA